MPDNKEAEPFHVSMVVHAIHFFSWFYDMATYIPWQLATYSSWTYQNRLKAEPIMGDTQNPWRMVGSQQLKLRKRQDCKTLDEDFERSCQEYGSLEALGTREILSEEDEVQSNGKVFKKLIMGDYKWRTYTEFLQDVDNFGKGLVSLGLQPKQNILIFAETRAEFQIGLQACFRYNFPAVTLYATLGEAAIAYGINQTGIKYVITTTTLLTKLKSIQKDIPTVTHIICMEDPVAKLDEKKLSNGIKVTSFQAVINRGAASKNVERLRPTAEDLAIIMYTSGSTGNPKGVMISHRNVLAAVCGAVDRINDVEVGETAAVYLPLAHILECVVELSLITLGCRLGYSSPQTLTDTGTKIKKGCPGDVRILKPNLIIFVPMILERIYKGITEKVKGGSALQRAIFNFAVDYKCKHLDQGFNTPILNRLIFSKLTRQLGGQVRLMICGGAPLASDLQRFIQSCFNSSLIQGYGLTETCGVACVSESRDMRIGHVGPPVTTTQVKLVDWPEGGYTNKDKPNPRGEVIVGGQNIAMGYYQMDQLTKEVFIQDNGIRYFCTGDIGEFLPDGSLKIIDRKKDLVKLQTGEYISLATIENFLKKSPFIDNICVYADPLYDYCLALIVPYKKAVQEAANNNNLAGKSFEELCGRSEILKEVLASLAATGKEAKLQKWEIPRKVHLCEEAWTPENGLVTDAFKLKRKPIANQYSAEINRMYGKHR
ncbi:long-chain-fatty-acid--CoA ligase 3 [Strongylocentrotus purpuratus]|uniref:long-chain-fatty-acid--CoA ligase n=1 Tax=Strongylocentrotus purpuratus TaxID=7668 RepID=A0A7M7NLD9_STRPU|nr:long-chain-fatty-acid--CoA ligase 3 [Strongylocentrotus purpuratus]XP_030838354.1 long-chain-fatty-acid--CoA ligase 3 [Strongylocentrotus purpuratus]